MIIGTIHQYGDFDYLDYKCPKRGVITELIVTKNIRSKGIGEELVKRIEEYYIAQGCEYVLIDVFANNNKALEFYDKNGYHPRMIVDIKKL